MRLIALIAASLAFPGLAHAETTETQSAVSVSGSLTIATAYVSGGVEYSDGPVIQPYVELGYGGLYAGVFATNAEEDLLGANAEIDFYLGYRGEAGVFYYDISYGYYTYPGASESNAGEVLVSGGAGLSDALFVTAYLGYTHESDTRNLSLGVDYYGPIESLTLSALFGDNEASQYWEVGASYALSDTISADLTWHDTDLADTKGLFVGGLTISF